MEPQEGVDPNNGSLYAGDIFGSMESSQYHYDHVLNFCAPRISRRVFPGKGMFGTRPAFQMAKGKRVGGRLAIIGVDTIKNVIYDRLTRGQGIRFSECLEPSFFEQLTSQRRVIKYQRGMPMRRFEMTSTRARKEALDAVTYGFAARQAVNISYDRREAELRGSPLERRSLASQLAGAGWGQKDEPQSLIRRR
jgi:phage terminase large subunit GpA-like protein